MVGLLRPDVFRQVQQGQQGGEIHMGLPPLAGAVQREHVLQNDGKFVPFQLGVRPERLRAGTGCGWGPVGTKARFY